MSKKLNKIRAKIDLSNNSKIMSKHGWLDPIDQNPLNSKADDYFRDVSYYIDLSSMLLNS